MAPSLVREASGAAAAKPLGLPTWAWGALGVGALWLLVRAREESEREYATSSPADYEGSRWAVLEGMQIEGSDYPRPDNPPAWVVDEPTWNRAKQQVRPYWAAYAEPWAVVATVYRQMGGATT